MKYFLLKLIPPRTSFASDMTPREAELMREHAVYWRGLMAQGAAIAFGPVADPKGVYGIGLLELEDGVDPHGYGRNDPTIQANAGFSFEVHPMPSVVVRGGRSG